jgi:hypothetical protein
MVMALAQGSLPAELACSPWHRLTHSWRCSCQPAACSRQRRGPQHRPASSPHSVQPTRLWPVARCCICCPPWHGAVQAMVACCSSSHRAQQIPLRAMASRARSCSCRTANSPRLLHLWQCGCSLAPCGTLLSLRHQHTASCRRIQGLPAVILDNPRQACWRGKRGLEGCLCIACPSQLLGRHCFRLH